MATDTRPASGTAPWTDGDELDVGVRATTKGSWIAAGVLAALLVAGLLWAILGTLPQSVSAPGTIVTPSAVSVVTSPVSGVVRQLPQCAPGCTVQAGSELYVIEPFNSSEKVKVKAPITGVLGATSVLLGTAVQGGSVMTTVNVPPAESLVQQNKTFAIVDASQQIASQFAVGSTVYVTPELRSVAANGSMVGSVSDVAQLPTGSALTGKAINNPTFRITVDLGTAPTWTVSPPGFDIASGTPVTVKRITSELHPIDLAF